MFAPFSFTNVQKPLYWFLVKHTPVFLLFHLNYTIRLNTQKKIYNAVKAAINPNTTPGALAIATGQSRCSLNSA